MKAAEIIDQNRELLIETDSKYAMNEAIKNLEKHEDQEIIKKTISGTHKMGKGHQGHERNEGADELAAVGAAKDRDDEVDIEVPDKLKITGAKLSAMTQKLAYRAIREIKEKKTQPRQSTERNIQRAKDDSRDLLGRIPTEEKLWVAIRHKDFSKEARYFLWMTMHDAYMVGAKWLRENFSAELRERSQCKDCGVQDTMVHILTQCESPGQEEIWSLTRELWAKTGKEWPHPSFGVILACGTAVFTNETTERPDAGRGRLYRILMSEAAKLIWNLRNERVIQKDGRSFSQQEVYNRWKRSIINRLQLDCRSSNSQRYGKKAISVKSVKNTWSKVIEKYDDLPTDWVQKGGVLVGIEPSKQRWRRRAEGGLRGEGGEEEEEG
ncbi:hypothetical protein BXZ70DRAFT_1003067 [Cristinia sonorae]|uniref:Reverse transcriptase zinc-binding domain-containing protein n=1 Tax=Cristinia sonorae TaxID=1940300 RepID=A0A8K0UEU0_9AGAR|nr:hypothetical protein BXZ70DRAFT_1003067 [Cristinia sonorae]